MQIKILRNFILLQVFTVYMDSSLQFVIKPFFIPLFTVALFDAKYNIFFPMTSETPLLRKVARNVSIKPSEVWEIAFPKEKNFSCTSCVPRSKKVMYISSFSALDKSVDPWHKKETIWQQATSCDFLFLISFAILIKTLRSDLSLFYDSINFIPSSCSASIRSGNFLKAWLDLIK